MTKKKAFRVGLISLGVLILIFIIYVAVINWMIETGRIVKWDNRWYTQGQLEEKYGPQYYEAEAKNTPEDVYSQFRQALLNDDIEQALAYIAHPERERYQKEFASSTLLKIYKQIPPVEELNRIEQDSLGNRAHYTYYTSDQNKSDIPYDIDFAKGVNGYWWIESI